MSGYGVLHKPRLMLSAACLRHELVKLYLHLYRKFASLMKVLGKNWKELQQLAEKRRLWRLFVDGPCSNLEPRA